MSVSDLDLMQNASESLKRLAKSVAWASGGLGTFKMLSSVNNPYAGPSHDGKRYICGPLSPAYGESAYQFQWLQKEREALAAIVRGFKARQAAEIVRRAAEANGWKEAQA